MKNYKTLNIWTYSRTELYIAILISFIAGTTFGLWLHPAPLKVPETYFKG